MKLTYDPKYNVAYIHLREKPAPPPEVETIHLSDGLKVDIAPDGTVYGIELLNANEQLGNALIVNGDSAQPTHIELRKVGSRFGVRLTPLRALRPAQPSSQMARLRVAC